jgi:AcrR family transcriptional regulator
VSSGPSARERILRAAAELFAERGFADATTLEIASRAHVSKRELYTLVGNKEAMLAACVGARGSRMRLPQDYPQPTSRETLAAALTAYGSTLLRELTDEGVIAMFRLGIAESKRSPAVARSILERGREPARAALGAILTSARASHLLANAEIAEMISRFNALLWGDVLVWVLLGLEKRPGPREIERRAAEATALFLSLYGR